MGPDIFDARVSGEKLVDAAIAKADAEHKRVLLLFGANWCPWCRRLHRTLELPAVAQRVEKSFVLVLVDVNTRNDKSRNAGVLERYGNPIQHGLPVFVVLDRTGKQLTTRETQTMTAPTDDEEADKLAAFLARWSED